MGFGMSTRHEAYDAELTAIPYGLLTLARGGDWRDYTIFTDSRAAMARVVNEPQGLARR